MKKSKFRLMALMMALLLALCRGCGISQCAALGGCLGLLRLQFRQHLGRVDPGK